jgi:PucR family transcriptional regulator, purine catabolism regulatory protein
LARVDLLEAYREAFRAAPVGIAFMSADWQIVACNAALCEILGRSEEELLSHSGADFQHPDDRELHAHQHEPLLAGEIDRYELEGRYIHRDGHIGWLHLYYGVVRDDGDGAPLVISVVEEITERRLMREIQDRLLGLVLIGQDTAALAGALSDLIESPVCLLDGYGRLLAHSDYAGKRLQIPSLEQLQASEAEVPNDLAVRPLRLGEEIDGYLIAEMPPAVRHTSVRAIDAATSAFALQLAMTSAVEEVEYRLRGDMFDALVSDRPPDLDSLLRWGRRLGCDIASLKLVAMVDTDDGERHSSPLRLSRLTRLVASACDDLAPGSIAVPRGDAVLAALAVPSAEQGCATLNRVIERLHHEIGISATAGVSCEVTSPIRLGAAVGEARQALDAARALNRHESVIRVDQLGLRHLLLGAEPPQTITAAARRTLGPLLESPRLKDRDKLIATLRVYLECLGSLETTSRRLRIHVTTLRQRLDRIEATLGLSLRDARSRTDLQLALEILRLDGAEH